jgi:hypothetical protein
MNSQESLNALKQLGTFVFAILVMRGYLTHDQSTAILGDLYVIVPALGSLGTIGWSIYAHWNMKKVPEGSTALLLPVQAPPVGQALNLTPLQGAARVVGAILVALFLGALLASLPRAAFAGDLPTKKAPSSFGSYATGGCGFYYGLNAMGAGASVNGGPPGATTLQGAIGATFGYGCPIGTGPGNFWFAEGNFDWANLNGTQSGLALTGPAHFEQRIGFGGPISTMLNSGLFPNLNPAGNLSVPALPGLPAGVTAGPSYPFLFASLHEQDISAQIGLAANREWLVSPGIGLGLQTRLSNNVVAETTIQWILNSNGVPLGPQKISFGNGAEAGFTLKY